jgi:hypothetical protein
MATTAIMAAAAVAMLQLNSAQVAPVKGKGRSGRP